MRTQNVKELIEEGREFLDDAGYEDLPNWAKMNVNAYMKGMKAGMELVLLQKTEHQDDAVVV